MARATRAQALATASIVEALAPLVTGTNPDGTPFTLPTAATAAGTVAANTAATIGTTSAQVLAANAAALERVFSNDSATATIYLAPGTAAAILGRGVRLAAAGGQWRTAAWTGAVQGIATGVGAMLAITEISA